MGPTIFRVSEKSQLRNFIFENRLANLVIEISRWYHLRSPAFPKHSRNSIILSNYSPRAASRAEVHHSAAVGSPDEGRRLEGRRTSRRPPLSPQATTRDANTWEGETAGKDPSLSSLYLEHRLYLSPFSLSLSLPFLSFGGQQVERETGGLAMYA